MGAPIWGTFAVNDHLRPHAFVAEVLLFDTLAVPYPSTDEERMRWLRPNEQDPDETWDPDGLDALLKVLGTQKAPPKKGRPLAFTVPWSDEKWRSKLSRLEAASIITRDSFHSTRQIVAMDEQLPGVVEAVAAYPSAAAVIDDLALRRTGGQETEDELETAAAVIGRPLLLPDPDYDPDRALHEAVRVARNEEFREARTAYHDWVRAFIAPLRAKEARTIDAASLEEARGQLERLIIREQHAVKANARTKAWNWAVQGVAILGLGLTTAKTIVEGGDALGLAELGASGIGLVAAHLAKPDPGRGQLTGASMFVTARRGLTWLEE
jgi:hypothetical protein